MGRTFQKQHGRDLRDLILTISEKLFLSQFAEFQQNV